jgi:hypothetical protein
MNPMYSILESPYRWSICAGLAFLCACFGAMFMLAFRWPHILAQVWLALWFVATVVFLVLAVIHWKQELDTALARQDARGDETR